VSGTSLGAVLDWASAERVVQTQQAVVGNVAGQSREGPPLVTLRVPVIREGALDYILTAQVKSESFTALIREQQLPRDWVAGIVDGNGNIVARAPALPTGTPASVNFQTEIRRGKEGWYRGRTVEGRDTYTAFRHSAVGDWVIGLAVPVEIVQAGARDSAKLVGIGVVAAVTMAWLLAFVIGKRIADPMRALATLARNVGAARIGVELPHSGVREVDAVAHALEQANSAVRERHLLDQREKDAIGAADRAKDEFIATLSHELRNPLAALTSAAAILRRNDLNSDVGHDARQVIERQIAHMSRMIEDLLDLSRVIAGKTHLKIERFDLAALCENVIGAWQADGRTARHVVTVEAQPAWVQADRTRIEQVLTNLFDNAIKFTAPGRRIRVKVAPDEQSAALEVEDEGQGIAPEMLGRVFDPFVQGYQWMSRDAGGLGLGLALVKRLVELQEGTVSVVSAGIGQGTTFTIRFPRVQASVAEDAATPLAAGEPGARKRVLVIDDNEDARRSLAVLLTFEGHQIYEAENGGRGIELAGLMHPDVVLIDIGLPDVSGYEVARRIRAHQIRGVTLVAV
ncbi:MAG TPA: ATP-binding protein, partial [Casimicrobiaceae bacterium]